MTPLTQDERLYEAALNYIGSGLDTQTLETRKIHLLGGIGPDGEGFNEALRIAVAIDAGGSVPEFPRSLQSWAMWGSFVESSKARQGDTAVSETTVGILDSIRGDEARLIAFQNGTVRFMKLPLSSVMFRRSKEPVSPSEPPPPPNPRAAAEIPPPSRPVIANVSGVDGNLVFDEPPARKKPGPKPKPKAGAST